MNPAATPSTTDACHGDVRRARLRLGFSLTELLVASAIAMVVMAAVASLFSVFGQTVSNGQSLIELNARMRNAAWRLRQDLIGLTCMPTPLVKAECNGGYFHVLEGGRTAATDPTGFTGDIDDVLAFTTSSMGTPFSGRLAGAAGFESPTAEIVWFCEPSDQESQGQRLYNLHRRQLLVSAAPDAGAFLNDVFANKGDSDLSYRQHANSLGDLAIQANRFLTVSGNNRKLTGDREGEDVILGNVVAFDVKIMTGAGTTNQTFETHEDGDATAPPLNGIEIRIRCVEPSSGLPREFKVVHSFGS